MVMNGHIDHRDMLNDMHEKVNCGKNQPPKKKGCLKLYHKGPSFAHNVVFPIAKDGRTLLSCRAVVNINQTLGETLPSLAMRNTHNTNSVG